MKFVQLAAVTVLALGTAVMAKADLLSIAGNDTYDTTAQTISFGNPASIGGTSTGIFSGFLDCTSCVTMVSTLNYGNFSSPVQLFTANDNGHTASLILNSIATTDDVILMGNDTVSVDGVSHNGTYELTTQFGGDGTSNVTFSASASSAATPEPASLALFGTGLLGIVGVARRRFSF